MKLYLLLIVVMLTVSTAWSQDQDHDQPPPPEVSQAGVRDRPPPHRRGLQGAELDEAIEILRELRPQLAERLERARENHPKRIAAMIQREYPRLRHLMRLKRHEPQLFELRLTDMKLKAHTRRLARQLHEAGEDADTAGLRATLREKLAAHFDVRQKARAYEIAMLKRRIEDLEASLAEHDQKRDELIERRMADLLANPPPSPPEHGGPQKHGRPEHNRPKHDSSSADN